MLDMRDTIFQLSESVRCLSKADARAKSDVKYERGQRHRLAQEVQTLNADLQYARNAHVGTNRELSHSQAAIHALEVSARYKETRVATLDDRQQGQLHSLKVAAEKLAESETRQASLVQQLRTAEAHNEQLKVELQDARRSGEALAERAAAAEEAAQDFFQSCDEAETALQAAVQRAAAQSVAHDTVVRELTREMSAAAKAAKVPAEPQSWDDLSYERERSRRCEDVKYLVGIFTQRAWRAKDVCSALHSAGLLDDVFEQREMWDLKIDFLQEQFSQLRHREWSVDTIISAVIDGSFSYEQVNVLRRHLALSLAPNKDGEGRHSLREFLRHPLRGRRGGVVEVPAPVPPSCEWQVALESPPCIPLSLSSHSPSVC